MPKPRVAPLPRSEASVRTVPARGLRGFPRRSVTPQRDRRFGSMRGEFARHSLPRDRYEFGRNNRSFESQRNYRPRFPPCGARTPPMRHERVPPRTRDSVDFSYPSFEQMARH